MAEKKIILSIDDDQLILRVLTNLLAPAYDIRIARSASDATQLMAQLQPDLILLDIEMPDVSGFEFLHTIRKNPKFMKTPVIIITGHSDEKILSYAEKSGASGVLTKPVDQDELFTKIDYAFKNPPKNILGL